MKTTQQKPTVTAPPAAMPDTPPDHTYCLDMYENNDVSIDSYELTRAEFNTLKQHLAGLRGLIPAVAEPAAAPTQPAQPPAPEVAPVLRYDELLHLREWKPEDKEALRARFLGGIMKSLETMCETRLQQAAQFVDLCEHNQGCITPAENFIADLMLSHYFFGGLIPDEVKNNLEGPDGFEANFAEFIDRSKHFQAMYPNTLCPPTPL
jgi:hypothetical protein